MGTAKQSEWFEVKRERVFHSCGHGIWRVTSASKSGGLRNHYLIVDPGGSEKRMALGAARKYVLDVDQETIESLLRRSES